MVAAFHGAILRVMAGPLPHIIHKGTRDSEGPL